ncbi:hypothetical protein JCM8202_001888 [Rhodotorula sphaerocarpa]
MSVEVSISGVFPTERLASVQNRLAAFVDTSCAVAVDESTYSRPQAQAGTGTGTGSSAGESQRVRVKQVRTRGTAVSSPAQWTIQVEQPPEARRTAPRALQFGVTEFAVEAGHDPRQLVSALGFEQRMFSARKTGWLYRRGNVQILVYQLSEGDDGPLLDPRNCVVDVHTRYSPGGTSRPVAGEQGQARPEAGGKGAQDRREDALASLEEVAAHLKGLVDLARVD